MFDDITFFVPKKIHKEKTMKWGNFKQLEDFRSSPFLNLILCCIIIVIEIFRAHSKEQPRILDYPFAMQDDSARCWSSSPFFLFSLLLITLIITNN